MAHGYLQPSCVLWNPRTCGIKLSGIQHVIGGTTPRNLRYTAPELGKSGIEDDDEVSLQKADVFSFAMM